MVRTTIQWLSSLFYGDPISKVLILAGARNDFSDLLSGSLFVLSGRDNGYALNPRIDFNLAQNADLTCIGGVTLGDKNSQFPPGLLSVIIRAAVYF